MKNKVQFVFDFIQRHKLLCAFMLGGLSVLSFAPRFWVLFAFVAFSGLMKFIACIDDKKTLFKLGYAFGFAHFAFGFAWIGNALLVDAVKFGWLYPITLIASGSFFGLFFAFPTMLTYYGRCGWQKWLIFSSSTVLFEWIRSFIFTGFPWNLMGYTLAFSDELIQTASVGGTYLLSLVAVTSYTLPALMSKKNRQYIIAGIVTVFLIMWGAGNYRIKSYKTEKSDVVVRIVQPSIPQQIKWDRNAREENFAKYLRMSSAKTEKNPDIIVWGETASPFLLDRDVKHAGMLKSAMPKGSYLVTGMITYEERDNDFIPYNSMVVFDEEAKAVGYYHKSHLVPFGEYIPFREYLPKFIRPVANAIGTFGQGRGPEVLRVKNMPSFGGIICYEAIFPAKVVDKDNRPDFLINVTNDGWYGDSSGPYQHWVATRLRAVEEGIEIVRAANNGISGVVDVLGGEKAKLELNDIGYIDVPLDKKINIKTLYSKCGNWGIVIFCLILLFLGFINVGCKTTFYSSGGRKWLIH